MYYKQNINDIQLVILSFDDVLFDFTKLRFNYLKRSCKINGVEFDEDSFIKNLGSSKTMYQNSPIQHDIMTPEQLNQKIEESLLSYCSIKGAPVKEGVDEFLELLFRKKIPVAAVSTHTTQQAEELFKCSRIFRKPNLIIGEEQINEGLPNPEIYNYIIDEFNISPKNVLVIASTYNSVVAANRLKCNVIFIPNLTKQNTEIDIRCMKTDNNLLDVINSILFGQYSNLDIKYPLVSIDEHQNITSSYQNLIKKYKDNSDILKTLETIYLEEFSLAQMQRVNQELLDKSFEQKNQEDTSNLDLEISKELKSDELTNEIKIPVMIESKKDILELNTLIDCNIPENELNEEEKNEILDETIEPLAKIIEENMNSEESIVSINENELTNPNDILYQNIVETISINTKDMIEALESTSNQEDIQFDFSSINLKLDDEETTNVTNTEENNEELLSLIDDIEKNTISSEPNEEIVNKNELEETFLTSEEIQFFSSNSKKNKKESSINEKENKAWYFTLSSIFFWTFLFAVTSLLIYIVFEDWFQSTNSIAIIIDSIVGGYITICRSIIYLVPFLSTQLVKNNIISSLFLDYTAFILITTLLLFTIVKTKTIINQRKDLYT